MHLKSFSTYGFKSFADKTELTFTDGITAVVGPNGSGKSNISDAIRWVLGEQSAKYLRGSKMEDVIFSGSSKRRALGVAEVTLNFDNTDRTLNIDFAEVSLTRRLYRNGDSEYLINKKCCRLKDIIDLMADTGLGKGSMAIIGQNKIDEILNSRPEERRALFEEAAGIAKYRLRKKEAVHRLEETGVNLTRINDIKTEVERQVEPLRIAAEKTRQFNDINEQLRNCRLTLLIHELDELKIICEKLNHKKAELESVYAQKAAEIGLKESACSTLQNEIDEIGSKFTQLLNDIKNTETELEKIKGSKAVLDERIENSRNSIAKAEEKNSKLFLQAEELEQKMGELAAEFDVVDKKRALAAYNVEKLTADIKEQEEHLELAAKSNEKLQSDILADMQNLLNLRNELRVLEQEQEQRVKKRELLKNEITQAEDLSVELENRYRALLDKEAGFENEKALYESETEKLKQATEKLHEEINKVKASQDVCQKNMTAVEARLQFLQKMQSAYEGFGYGIKSVLKSNEDWRSGIIGVVAELIKVEPQFVTAIETALGESAQNIVTEDADIAKKAIGYLKSKALGRATFLPLDTVKSRSVSNDERKLLNLQGICGFAYELITYDEKVSNIIKFLLGRVLVAENIDAALHAAKASGFRLRVVTLDGDVVNAGGSMTGGSKKQKEGFLSRAKDVELLQRKFAGCKKEMLTWQEKLEELEAEFGKSAKKLILLKEKLQQAVLAVSKNSYEVKNIQQEKMAAAKKLEVLLDERSAVVNEYMSSRDQVKLLRENVKELENKDLTAKQLLEDMQRKLAAEKSAVMVLHNQLQDAKLLLETSTAKTGFISERIRSLDESALNLRNEIKSNETENIRLQKLIDECITKKSAYDNRSEELLGRLQQIEADKNEYQKDKIELINKQQLLEQEISDLKKSTAENENKLRQVELDLAKRSNDCSHITMQLQDDYGIADSESVKASLMELPDKELKRLESKLAVEISMLGPINQAAIEEYEAINERCEFLNKQYLDLCTAKDNLEAVISEINTGMTRRFKEAFVKINEYFAKCYVKLFGGGTAVLKFSNPEDILNSGIDIEVQPPGKHLQSLYLMSGGERSLTVIALLFALLSYQPAPFCILDEIDAALDDANIVRFSNLLRDFVQDTQFIVITHRKGTMECADVMYGVTMEESGVSKLLSVKINEKE